MKPSAATIILTAVTACHGTAPLPVAPRSPTIIEASFGRTSDAVIDAFAENNASIQTLDRSSGLIVPAGRTYAPGRDKQEALTYADCGKSSTGTPIEPTSVKYNVVVRGDSTHSTVLVRAFYSSEGAYEVCESRGRYEIAVEANVKSKAERATR